MTVTFDGMIIVGVPIGSDQSLNHVIRGTAGDDAIGNTGWRHGYHHRQGGTDCYRVGRNDSDTIFYRFSSTGTDWSNTDGDDTITNYVRNGTTDTDVNSADTFIFVDRDATSVNESQFIADGNVQLFADVTGSGTDLTITGFDIVFVDPTNPSSVESTISIDYNTALQPITDVNTVQYFGLESVTSAGRHEATDHLKWGPLLWR